MKFYTNSQLLMNMKEYTNEILGKQFICKTKERSFNCVVKDILPSPPDNIADYISVETIDGQVEEISVFDIERLTLVE